MATIQPVVDLTLGNMDAVVTWGPLANGDVGADVQIPGRRLISLQLIGTLGVGGNVAIEASNEAEVTTRSALVTALSALGISTYQDGVSARNVRPRVTAGDGTTALTVIALYQRGS